MHIPDGILPLHPLRLRVGHGHNIIGFPLNRNRFADSFHLDWSRSKERVKDVADHVGGPDSNVSAIQGSVSQQEG